MNVLTATSRLGQLLVIALALSGSTAFGQLVTTGDYGQTVVTSSNSISQSYSFSGQGGGDLTYDFDKFDSSLGTLTSVTLQLAGITVTGTASITNSSNAPIPYGPGGSGYSEDLGIGFTSTFVASSSVTGSDTVTVQAVSSMTSTLGVAPGATVVTGTQTVVQSPNPQNANLADIGSYIGTGTGSIVITLDASTNTNTTAKAAGNTAYFAAFASAVASGSVTLIYTFTPVPEPSTTAACMIGFALCIMLGRRYLKGRGHQLA